MQVHWKETPPQVLSCAYGKIFKNIYFEKYLQTAALFVFGCLFTIIKKNYGLLWWRKCALKEDYVIQWCIFLKGRLKSLIYTWWSLMYQF